MGLRANTTLFRSRHAFFAAAGLVVVLAGLGFRLTPTWHQGGSHGAMLVTGWGALAGMLILLSYVARKYMHKLGYSPEFRRRVALAEFEDFERRLIALQDEILRQRIRDPQVIRSRLPGVVRGVERIVRVEIVAGDGPDAPPRLVARPTEPFGRTARWLHAHVYFGALFAILVLLHARGGMHSTLGVLLNGLALLVTLTGIGGIALWSLGPTWLSRRERHHKLSIEQAFVLRKHYRLKVQAALATLAPAAQPVLDELWRARRAPDFVGRARRALAGPAFTEAGTLEAGRDILVLIGQYRRVIVALRDLWRVRLTFMAWRYVHIPAALLLLGFVLLHLISVWKY